MYYLISLVFFLSFVAFIYFSFQVHFCSIFPHFFTFLAFFFLLYFKWVYHVLHLYVIIFSFLLYTYWEILTKKLCRKLSSLLAFCKSSEKTVKTIQTIGKTQIPFDFAVVLFWSSATKFALFLSTFPFQSLYRQSSKPKTSHVPRALSYSSTKRTLRTTAEEGH